MSDSTKTTAINDLLAKTSKPNHLASKLEHQAAAGAAVPKHLSHQYHHLQQTTQLVRQALSGIFPSQLLDTCYVVSTLSTELTLSMGSPTAANHARYMMMDCVQALRAYDQRFCQLQSIKVILTPQMTQSDSRQEDSKGTLSENTKQIISQSAQFVTKNERLRTALLNLTDDND